MIYHQFHQVQFAIDEWLALARAVLAQALQNAALVTPPLAARARVRRVELVPLHEGQVSAGPDVAVRSHPTAGAADASRSPGATS